MFKLRVAFVLCALAAIPAMVTSASAAQCGGDFNTFIANFSREAAGQGISQSVLSGSAWRRDTGSDGSQFRSPPACHLQPEF